MSKQTHLDAMFTSLGECFKPSTTVMELAAVWIDGGIITFNVNDAPTVKKKSRITKGDTVCVLDGVLYNYGTFDTVWEIVKCSGNIDSSVLKLQLKEPYTQELITITL